MSSPLLEEGAIDGARGILINISGSSSLKLSEVNEASTIIQSSAHEDANIIFGAVLDESLGDDIKITVIATGFRPDLPSRGADPQNTTAHRGVQLPNGVPASAFSNRPVASPKFASEIAEEQAQQATAPSRTTTPTAAHAAKPAEAPARPSQPRDAQSSAASASPQHGPTADRPAAPVHPARVAEMEDQQLDVPAYLRRNDL
jgi:cell division protein FtsZ